MGPHNRGVLLRLPAFAKHNGKQNPYDTHQSAMQNQMVNRQRMRVDNHQHYHQQTTNNHPRKRIGALGTKRPSPHDESPTLSHLSILFHIIAGMLVVSGAYKEKRARGANPKGR